MKAYEQGAGAYFATPPVNLIYAFNESLKTITKSTEVSLEERFKRHEEASKRVKSAAKELGLRQVSDPENAANGMTAVSFVLARFPRGFRLTIARLALLSQGIRRFGHSPTALRERCRCRGRVAQGYQERLLPHRVTAIFLFLATFYSLTFFISDTWEFPLSSNREVT